MQDYRTIDKFKKLGIDPDDPEIQGRPFHDFKMTFKSVSRDPWMDSAFTVNRGFLGWVASQRKGSTGFASDIPNLKAEIRNDFVRARDLWEEYLVSKGKVAPLTVGYDPPLPVLSSALNANLINKRTNLDSGAIAKTVEDQYRRQNWQQNKPRYLTHEYLDFMESENSRRTQVLIKNNA
jgi:hypothetical protein